MSGKQKVSRCRWQFLLNSAKGSGLVSGKQKVSRHHLQLLSHSATGSGSATQSASPLGLQTATANYWAWLPRFGLRWATATLTDLPCPFL